MQSCPHEEGLPLHRIVAVVAECPDELFTVRARVEVLRNLALVCKRGASDVRFFGWKAMAERARDDGTDTKPVERLVSTNLVLATDTTVSGLLFDFYGPRTTFQFNPCDYPRRRVALLRCVAPLYCCRNEEEMRTRRRLLTVRIRLLNEEVWHVPKILATAQYGLRPADIRDLPYVLRRSYVRVRDVRDVCMDKYGGTAFLRMHQAAQAKIKAERRERACARRSTTHAGGGDTSANSSFGRRSAHLDRTLEEILVPPCALAGLDDVVGTSSSSPSSVQGGECVGVKRAAHDGAVASAGASRRLLDEGVKQNVRHAMMLAEPRLIELERAFLVTGSAETFERARTIYSDWALGMVSRLDAVAPYRRRQPRPAPSSSPLTRQQLEHVLYDVRPPSGTSPRRPLGDVTPRQ